MATSAEQLKPGTLLNGRYQITRPLGRGGMGTVFLAEHLQLQSILAIKEVCSPGESEEERQATLEQYQREARFLVQLNHPNLPKVTDAFVESDRFYLVMEYIEGVTLEMRLKERGGRPLPVIQVVEWGLQIADVLSYLHNQNPPIIFRDLKPANVMVKPDNTIRLIDFGIARRFQQGAVHDTSLFGSVGYSPPEQFGRQQTDARSDIYAFGVTLHQMLTGIDPSVHPFKFVPVSNVNLSVPKLLSELIQQCVSMDPDARPADIHQVAMGLVASRELMTTLEPEVLEEQNRPAPPDAMNAPTASGRTGSGPSGTGTGPRIISAKLAEAEAERRRNGSQEMGRNGAGKVGTPVANATPPAAGVPYVGAKPSSTRNSALLVGALLLLLAASGTAYVASRSHTTVAKTPVVHAPVTPPVTPADPQTHPPVTPPDAAVGITGSDGDDSHVVINNFQVVSANLVILADKAMALQLTVKGEVTGSHTSKISLSGQFTDGNNTPIPANRGSTAFNGGGALIFPDTPIAQDVFEKQLNIPLNEFPPTALNSPVKFNVAAKIDGRLLKEADSFTIPAALFAPYTAKLSEGTALPNGATPAPTDPPKNGKNGGSLGFDSFHGSGGQ
ncbi:MAG: Serine/threonine protein kinase [Chthonomonadaceae bacterium]|nr:Serine/threonine protein kinase [Chthonomonadaceae bacterium]